MWIVEAPQGARPPPLELGCGGLYPHRIEAARGGIGERSRVGHNVDVVPGALKQNDWIAVIQAAALIAARVGGRVCGAATVPTPAVLSEPAPLIGAVICNADDVTAGPGPRISSQASAAPVNPTLVSSDAVPGLTKEV